MNNNRQTLDRLFAEGGIDLRRGPIFDTLPEPLRQDFDFSRIEGMMLGLAVGDALGEPSEGMSPSQRWTAFGEVADYFHVNPELDPLGLPTDDTQLAFWTLEQMLADSGLDPDHLAARFCRERIVGIGATVARFVQNCRSGAPWHQSGPKSAGNGALMRIAPVLIPHLRAGTTDLWSDTALAAMLTHNDSGSTAACLAYVNILWQLLRMDGPPEPDWWLNTYVEVARELEVGKYRTRGGAFAGWEGPMWRFARDRVNEALETGISPVEACERWGSGAYLLETVPCVLYLLTRYAGDLEEAVVRAVNDTRDNDTVAAIVGAAVGALHGKEKIPERWMVGLSGRTAEHDDGRVFELLDQARRVWWR